MSEPFVSSAVLSRIEPTFLPVVAVNGGRRGYAEALLRTAEDGGHTRLIRRAETDGSIWVLDVTMLTKICRLLRETRQDFRVGLNVSAVTVQGRAESWLKRLREERDCVAGRIVVELTETAAQTDHRKTLDFVSKCRDCGAEIAIDDFDSNAFDDDLVYQLEPDYIKVGRGWLLNGPDSGERLVRALTRIAPLGVPAVVVEWIDTEWKMLVAQSLGVSHLQGTHVGAHQDLGSVLREFGLPPADFLRMASA